MALSDLQTALNNYQEQLALDSVAPLLNYSLGGQVVTQQEWRAAMIQACADLNKLIIAMSPYVVVTRNVL